MGQINIRLDDELHVRLRQVESISEFIRDAIKEKLDDKQSKGSTDLLSIEAMLDERFMPLVDLIEEKFSNIKPTEEFVPKAPDPTTGYPCCTNDKKPCKHWQWDGVKQSYTNTITGEVREIYL